VVRGVRGTVQRVDVPAGAWRRVRAADGTLLRARLRDAHGRWVRVSLYRRGTHATLRLTARVADVWCVDADDVQLTIDLGRIHADTHATAEQMGPTLYVFPEGGAAF